MIGVAIRYNNGSFINCSYVPMALFKSGVGAQSEYYDSSKRYFGVIRYVNDTTIEFGGLNLGGVNTATIIAY